MRSVSLLFRTGQSYTSYCLEMKPFASIFLFALVHNTLASIFIDGCSGSANNDDDAQSCPSTNYCTGQTSPIADLICLSNRQQTGFNYIIIGFGNKIAGICSIYYDCQPGRKAEIRIVEVLGFLVRLPSRHKSSNGKYVYGSNLWFINEVTPGCPSYYKVENVPYTRTASFNRAISPLPISDAVVYGVYESMFGTLECECNYFRAMPTGTGNDRGYSGPFYSAESTISVIGLQDIKCAYLYSIYNDSATRFINSYGVSDVDVRLLPTPVPNAGPTVYREVVTVRGFDTHPYCRDFTNTASISDILKSYDYYVNCLNRYTGSKVAAFYAQGLNPKNSQSRQSTCYVRNTASITDFCSIAFLPHLRDSFEAGYPSQRAAETVFWLLNGFCQYSILEKILTYFL